VNEQSSTEAKLRLVTGGADPTEPDELRLSIDLDAEAAVLSAIMNDETQLDGVRPFLRPEHFYAERHRRMYEAACLLRDEGTGIDIVTLATKLRDTDRLAQVGGMAYITTVLNAAPVLDSARMLTWARSIVEKWVRREYKLIGATAKAAAAVDAREVAVLLGETRDRVDRLTIELGSQEKDAVMREVLRRTTERLQSMRNTDGRGRVPSGFDRVDRMIGGLPQTLMIVAGRPGMGKTSLAMGMGLNVAATREGEPARGVYMASMETFDEEAMTRLWCSDARVSVQRARTGMLGREDWERLTQSASRINALPFWIDDEPGQTVTTLWSKARRADMLLQRDGGKLELVIIDYLQLLRAPRAGMGREDIVSENARALLSMSTDLRCCVMALSQLNRECERRPNKRPILSDLRESGEIEQAARVIAFVYRDEYYNRDTRDRNLAEIIIAKQNNGPTGTVMLRFDGTFTRFDNLADGEWASGDGEEPYYDVE
jgi:replicative DNA helicase